MAWSMPHKRLIPANCTPSSAWVSGFGLLDLAFGVSRSDANADKKMIKLRHAVKMIANERDILASVDSPFITGLQYSFCDEQEVGCHNTNGTMSRLLPAFWARRFSLHWSSKPAETWNTI